MRKRAQLKGRYTEYEPRHITERPTEKFEEKPKFSMRKSWIAIALIGIFFLVLFYNSYFNVTSGLPIDEEATGLGKYLLSGPDPYYNMRLVQVTHETGRYPFYTELDPMLNYPLGESGGRAPLLNMMALGFSRFLSPFMSEIDAIGYSMQFIPALFGALLVFPVYFIGKTLFNKKAGLIAALLLAVIPIHIGSGHGSAYTLFDHDSLNLLLFFLTFLFLLLSLRENDKVKSVLYAVLGGVSLAGLNMVWTEAKFLFVIIAAYAIIQMVFDIFTNKISFKVLRTTLPLLFSGYLISLPVIAVKGFGGFTTDLNLFLCLGVLAFGIIYYISDRRKIPWTVSMPAVISIAAVALIVLYFIRDLSSTFKFLSPLRRLSIIVFGEGVYGNKVSMTIAEANTYQISHTVMSFGPALYWIGWAGFVFLLWYYYKDKLRRDYLFIIFIFIVNLWLAGTAGRFLNDMVPLIAILSGWIIWFLVSKIDYKQMLRNIRSAGGGIHGIRRGVKLFHIFGILFLALIVILPNALVAFDAALPNTNKLKDDGENWTSFKGYVFGDDNYQGAYGLTLAKEMYWGDAFRWLSQQDTDISDPVDRPAFISWWDYGFYASALGGHPTVADNFQDGIPPASNFHTATSEKEAVTVWCVRLLEGYANNNGELSDEIIQVLDKYFGNNSELVVSWVMNPEGSPSYNEYINEEYHKYISDEISDRILVVGSQWEENALYHDFVNLVKNETYGLTDEQVTWLYHDLQDATGYSIRYYGVEGYDEQIFNIFAFLSDKSLVMLGAPEDDFTKILFTGKTYVAGTSTPEKTYTDEPLQTYFELSDNEKRRTIVERTPTVYKDDYFDTMFYKTYIGPYKEEDGQRKKFDYQVPCYDMKHFYAEYISVEYGYTAGKAAVVIAKYYEGALINGTVSFKGNPINATVVVQKNLSGFRVPLEHDKSSYIGLGNSSTHKFNVLVGAGAHLQIRRNLGQSVFVLKNITFNGPEGSVYAPITDSDAMRRSDNYERFLNISIEPANISGFVFNDVDNDGKYNASFDEPLKDINVNIQEITNIKADNTFDRGYTSVIKIDENGFYNFTDLLPGLYRIHAYDDEGYTLDLNDMALYEGNRTYNIIEPMTGDLEGIVYYDKDLDEKYDSGEEIVDANIELKFAGRSLGNYTTLNDGSYLFTNLTSGEYNEYTLSVKTDEYQADVKATVKSNTTSTQNISLELVPVIVSGGAFYNGEGIDEVDIEFSANGSIDRNTAKDTSTMTDKDGEYNINLQPGSYNISIIKTDSSGNTIIYILEGETLVLTKGQKPVTRDFDLERKSVTVSGITFAGDIPIENVTLNFLVNRSTAIENNTAIETSIKSNQNGLFTIELAPGFYNVTGESEERTDADGNFSYYGKKSIEVKEEEIGDIKTFNFDTLGRMDI
jgi:dolichyl-diphosphooligosaccharide--protein glycosyltransferase